MHFLLTLATLGALLRQSTAQSCATGSHLSQGRCCADGTEWSPSADAKSGRGLCCPPETSYQRSSTGKESCCPAGYELQEEGCVMEWSYEYFWTSHMGKWFQLNDQQWVQVVQGGFQMNGQLITYSASGVYINGQRIFIDQGSIVIDGKYKTLFDENPNGNSGFRNGRGRQVVAGGGNGAGQQIPIGSGNAGPDYGSGGDHGEQTLTSGGSTPGHHPNPGGSDGNDGVNPVGSKDGGSGGGSGKVVIPQSGGQPGYPVQHVTCNCGGGSTPPMPSPPQNSPANPTDSNNNPQASFQPQPPSGQPAAGGACGCRTAPACFGENDIGIQYGKCYNLIDVNGLHLGREVGGVYQSGGDVEGLIFRVCKSTSDCSADLGQPVGAQPSSFYLQDQLGWKDWKGPAWFSNNFPHFAIDRKAKAVKFSGEGMCSFGLPAVCLRDGDQGRGMAAPCPMGTISEKSHIYYTKNPNSCKPYRFIETQCLQNVGEEEN